MVQILRKLPFQDVPSIVKVGEETVDIRAYQIIAWVSLDSEDALAGEAPCIPVVQDSGHSHNFSIQEEQLSRWAGLDLATIQKLGNILVNKQEVPLVKVNVWIHRNKPGTTEVLPKPYRLEVPQGIAVYPEGTAGAPRLPLLGIRGIVRNRLKLTINGKEMWVSLSS